MKLALRRAPGLAVDANTLPFAISTRGLVKAFGTVRAVDGIDLDVPRGVIFAILGPNGAGKTTLMRMLATLAAPDAGSAMVMGHDLVAAPDQVCSSIAMTGQFASLDEDLTGRENLLLLARLWGFRGKEAKARADELLAAFDLADAATRQVKNYSGGMRRWLDIAASLVVTPGVLFLDEPTTGLDPKARQGVWRMIRALADSGVTILLTTQYLDEADQLAARIVVIDHGKKIAEGTSRELKRATGSGFLHVTLADPARLPDATRLFDRFRSLPIWSLAPFAGLMVGDILRHFIAATIILTIGLLLGYRPEAGIGGVLAAFALLIGIGFGMGWIFIVLGLLISTPMTVMTFGFTFLFPLVFASNIMVDPATMPGWLRAFVEVNPVSLMTTAMRGLLGNGATSSEIVLALAFPIVLTVVLAPVTLRLYRRH